MSKEEVEATLEQESSPVEDTSSEQIEVPAEPEDKGGKDAPKTKSEETVPQDSNPKWWSPEAFKLKYRGQTVSPKDYKHAVTLMQQGWSYSEAMAQLKGEKEQFESQKGKYTQYEKLEQAFAQNPAFAQRIWQMYQEAQTGKQQPGQQQVQQDPQYHQLFQTVSSLQERLRSFDESNADKEVQREVDDIKSKLSDVQWDQVTETGHTLMYDVLNHAYKNRFPSLMAAARDYLWDTQVANAKMAGAQQVATAKQRATKAGVVQSGANSPVQAQNRKVNVRDVSYDDLAQMALKDLGKA